jgi:hypothetical protein
MAERQRQADETRRLAEEAYALERAAEMETQAALRALQTAREATTIEVNQFLVEPQEHADTQGRDLLFNRTHGVQSQSVRVPANEVPVQKQKITPLLHGRIHPAVFASRIEGKAFQWFITPGTGLLNAGGFRFEPMDPTANPRVWTRAQYSIQEAMHEYLAVLPSGESMPIRLMGVDDLHDFSDVVATPAAKEHEVQKPKVGASFDVNSELPRPVAVPKLLEQAEDLRGGEE